MKELMNVVYSRESKRDGFIVRFNTFFDYFATHYEQIYEPIIITKNNYWDATIFPLYMEEKVKKLLETNLSWNKRGSYTILYLSYKNREEIVFSDKNKSIMY